MKIKFLAVLGLAAVAGLGGCKSAATNANIASPTSTNMAVNSNMGMTTSTPMTSATMAPAADSATKATVESALKSAGITGVTVDATTAEIILRGSVAKGKLGEAVRIANEKGGGKRVSNQLTEMK